MIARPDSASHHEGTRRTAEIGNLARDLANAVSGEVRTSLHDRLLYATDASIYQQEPLAVVIPDSTEDAARAVRFCHDHDLPILPRGGGTSLAGQGVNRAVVIDVSAACCELLELDATARRCRVEPGLTVDDLNDCIAHTGLFFPPDPSTARHANIGGCIGNNAAGSHSVKYGRTTESLLAVDALLTDGRRVLLDEGAALRDPVAAELTKRIAEVVQRNAALIRERFPKTVRRNAGYALDLILQQLDANNGGFAKVNLAHLLCGSEGTLATTLGAELRLSPIPKNKGLAVIAFAKLEQAIDAVVPILNLKNEGLGPAAVELLDDLIVNLARENIEYRRYVDLLPTLPAAKPVQAVLYVEFFSEHEGQAGLEEVTKGFDRLRQMFGSDAVQSHTDGPSMANAWKLRKAGEPLLHAIPGERKPLGFIEDNAVPPEHLPEFVSELRRIVESRGTIASYYAHASVGVLHVRPLLNLKSAADRRMMEEIATETAALAKRLDGVMSGEHGDGKARGPLLDDFYGPALMRAFVEVKAIFDPKGLMNPGNIVPQGPTPEIGTIHQRTRVQPAKTIRKIPGIPTYFDYADQTDFAHAVEMCNGAGVCRKKTGGVMCPSYMATRDERHSTRGRGNALRLAISGQTPLGGTDPDWHDEETKATLDLCLSCKACKSECPSNVDISRLKAEYQQQGYDRKGRAPLRAYALGYIHALNRLASITPPLINAMNTFPPVRAILNKALGFHPDRTLPRWEKPLHRQWPTDDPTLPSDAPEIVLYADTFTNYNEPAIGLAAKRVLEAFGYRVKLFRGTDAARALISVGLLAEAIRSIDKECARIARDTNPSTPILTLEPSVKSAITDDWLTLKCETPIAERRAIAARVFHEEHFLAANWDRHPRTPSVIGMPGRIAVHAHCHHKSLDGAHTASDLLSHLFPGNVDTLDTTCCGMAGSFGYGRDRFALSMDIGELSVFPAVDALGADDALVASGTSCRHQIKDGRGVRALHPLEFIADRLTDQP